MTQAEWLASSDPGRLLALLGLRPPGRKFRLFAVAYCRRVGHLLPDPSREAVDAAELLADGRLPQPA